MSDIIRAFFTSRMKSGDNLSVKDKIDKLIDDLSGPVSHSKDEIELLKLLRDHSYLITESMLGKFSNLYQLGKISKAFYDAITKVIS
jgi:hypothetical protein